MDEKIDPFYQEQFERKAQWRKDRAKDPIETKLADLVRMQGIAYAIARAAGRECAKPWKSSEHR